MRSRTLTLAALLSAAPGAAAQTSEYFVVAGVQRTLTVLHGGAISRQWATPADEYPLAMPPGAGEVRTTGFKPALPGRTYDYDGNVIGGLLRHNIPGECYDSTSDGTHNYLVNFLNGDVYATDLNYKNEKFLFNIPFVSIVGITYDPRDDSLWVSEYNEPFVSNWTLKGEFRGEWSTGHLENTALAFDPADGTLWLYDHSHLGTFEQWHTSGILLQRFVIPEMQGQGLYGGEFAYCYPDFDGSGDLNLFDFLGFTNAFNAADPQADCDADGQFSLFDFLCFTNAFNAGC